MTAAALSYTTVLSLVPILAVLLAVMAKVDYFGQLVPRVEQAIVQNISSTAGAEGVRLIQKAVGRIQKGRLGTFGAVILIVVVSRAMLSLDRAVHRIWQIRNRRKIHQKILVYWGLILIIPMLLAIWIYISQIARSMGYQIPAGSGYVLVFFILFMIQRYLPSFEVQPIPILTGTLVSVVLLFLLTVVFAKLTAEVYRYSKIYGSLAAIPTFLLWIYMIWISILLGIAVSSIFSKTKQLDATK